MTTICLWVGLVASVIAICLALCAAWPFLARFVRKVRQACTLAYDTVAEYLEQLRHRSRM